MKEFIKGTLVPMLVRSYIDDMKKRAKEEVDGRIPPTTLPPVQ